MLLYGKYLQHGESLKQSHAEVVEVKGHVKHTLRLQVESKLEPAVPLVEVDRVRAGALAVTVLTA